MKRLGLPVLVLLLFCVPALAQTLKPFSQSELDKYLIDYPAVVKFLDEQGGGMEAQQPDMLADIRMTKEFEGFLGSKGWNTQRFLYVTRQLASGIVALQMADQGPRIQSEFEQTKAEIMKSPDLTPEQKKQFLAQMEQSMAQTKAMGDASKLAPGELALIKTNKGKIFKAFEIE